MTKTEQWIAIVVSVAITILITYLAGKFNSYLGKFRPKEKDELPDDDELYHEDSFHEGYREGEQKRELEIQRRKENYFIVNGIRMTEKDILESYGEIDPSKSRVFKIFLVLFAAFLIIAASMLFR